MGTTIKIPDFFNETLAHTLNPNTINKAVPTNSPKYNVKSSILLPSSENEWYIPDTKSCPMWIASPDEAPGEESDETPR